MGSINTLMAFKPDLRINPCQFCLLADACAHALDTITGEVRAHLCFDERALNGAPSRPRSTSSTARSATPWSTSGSASTRVAADGCMSIMIEAIETAGEIASSDTDELARTRVVLAKKYDRDMLEAKLFQHPPGSFHPMVSAGAELPS